MELNNLLTPECIVANLKATSKKQALQEISKRIAEVTGENERDIFDVLGMPYIEPRDRNV